MPAPITEVGYGLPYRNYRAWQSLGLSLSHLIGCMKRIVHELYCTKPRPHAVSLAGAQVNEVGGWWCACYFPSPCQASQGATYPLSSPKEATYLNLLCTTGYLHMEGFRGVYKVPHATHCKGSGCAWVDPGTPESRPKPRQNVIFHPKPWFVEGYVDEGRIQTALLSVSKEKARELCR